ncbi:hypothetical protein O6H91_Y286300 [Diphasiastrum complanatum]|nr:hypothetical protein O6H91_Y286300 [Diphasiastrum complanatum]
MATRKRDLSGLYPQRKSASASTARKPQQQQQRKGGGNKKLSSPVQAVLEDTSIGAASLGSSFSAQPSALPSFKIKKRDDDEFVDVEEVLRQFDMNMSYGPCLGVSRTERWNRAHHLGLNPPHDVKNLLEHAGGAFECLWEGSV